MFFTLRTSHNKSMCQNVNMILQIKILYKHLNLILVKWKPLFKPFNHFNHQSFHHLHHLHHQSHKSYSVLFFGSDSFSLPTLELLHHQLLLSNLISNLQIVSSNHQTCISQYALKHSIQLHLWPINQEHVFDRVFDLGVVASFGHLIPSKLIQCCDHGILNIHGSLLPRWRGASPIQHAILHGDHQTGVTIMRIKAKQFDIGDILAQKECEIHKKATYLEMKDLMAKLGAQLIWKCLCNLEECCANAKPQPDSGITYAPKLKPTDGQLNWNTMTANQIELRCRAFEGCLDVYSHWIDSNQLRLYEMLDSDSLEELNLSQSCQMSDTRPGQVYFHRKRKILCVLCADQKWIAFKSVQLKGKKRISAIQFYNGFMSRLNQSQTNNILLKTN